MKFGSVFVHGRKYCGRLFAPFLQNRKELKYLFQVLPQGFGIVAPQIASKLQVFEYGQRIKDLIRLRDLNEPQGDDLFRA